ncbi:MAG: DUF547 domain-containing protein [Planctomycetota bacterium]|jgi:hypothetical protein
MTKFLGTIVTLTVIAVSLWGCQPENEHNASLQQQSEAQILTAEPEPQDQEDGALGLETRELNPQEPASEQVESQVLQVKIVEPEESIPRETKSQEVEPQPAVEAQPDPEQPQAEVQAQEGESEEDVSENEPEAEMVEDLAELDILSQWTSFYETCENIFTVYVDEQGRVDYDTLRRKRAELLAAVREFDKVHPAQKISWSRNEKIAFWINAHNIFTLKMVIDNYPIQPRWYLINYPDNSIMHIPGGREKKYFKIMGMEYTLREIEREILIDRFADPRIVFALSYASKGSALLRNEPYYPDRLDQQLDEQVRKFLSIPQGFKIDRGKRAIVLSDIFNWYKPLFIEKYASVKRFRDRKPGIQSYLNFIVNYVPPDNAGYFESDDYVVRFQYDWHLNEQP